MYISELTSNLYRRSRSEPRLRLSNEMWCQQHLDSVTRVFQWKMKHDIQAGCFVNSFCP